MQHALDSRAQVSLHRSIFFQPTKSLLKNLSRSDVRWHDDPVVHPLPVSARCNDSGAPQISKVTRDLRLGLIQNLDEVADADFLIAHQVEQPEASIVAKCLKEPLDVECLFRCHVRIIFALTDV